MIKGATDGTIILHCLFDDLLNSEIKLSFDGNGPQFQQKSADKDQSIGQLKYIFEKDAELYHPYKRICPEVIEE